ncbi:MAG: phosphatidylserine decarboxylase family protein [Ignavibacteriales bacterium]|nr:phosphatidylserine decarboxylase family protein [Ignavibacteriales bacterium]
MITEYGYDVFFSITAMCLVVGVGSYFLIDHAIVKTVLITLAILIFIFTLNFFRDPERVIPAGDGLVISPADGTVIKIEDVVEDRYIKAETKMVSIFMSPVNVHVNRHPISGSIGYFEHVPGEFFAAFEDKASLKNEQTHIGIENGKGKVFFKQIAGFIARRIVANLKVGDSVEIGKRFGMIKFGSRVDIYVPKDAEIKVVPNQRTVAGETIVAVMK